MLAAAIPKLSNSLTSLPKILRNPTNVTLSFVKTDSLNNLIVRTNATTTPTTTTTSPFPPPKWAQAATETKPEDKKDSAAEPSGLIRKGGIRKGGIYKTDEEEAAEAKAKKEKQSEQDTHNILEKGHVYFYYRPKMNIQEAQTLDDVQMLYILLCPKFQAAELLPSLEGEKKTKPVYMNRLLTLSKKKLPEINERSRYWAFVAVSSKDMNDINDWLAGEKYLTKTRGERELQGSISVGEGIYAVIEHNDHTHFGYILKSMNDLGELTKAFNIEKEGSYVISIKNPERADPTHYLRDKHKAHFPPELQEQFRGRRFMTAVNPEFLDHKGCEVVVIGAYDDVGVEIAL